MHIFLSLFLPLTLYLLAYPSVARRDPQVLMQKMKSISQQHKHMGDEDRSPEELQKVFEKVEIALQATGGTPPKEPTSAGVLKEKDQNTLQTQQQSLIQVQTPVNGASTAAPSAVAATVAAAAAAAVVANPSPTASAADPTVASGEAAVPPPPSPPAPHLSRFVIDPDFTYIDFARRGANSEFTTFRVQDYSWDDHGFSLVNQLYNDVGNLLDEKFKKTYNMTYYTMGRKTNVDTSMFRRAIWNYIQCIFGIRHDDYDYREVNELLTRDLKTYIKTVCCFPSRVRREDCDRVMPEFWRSEKIHVNLMITEARMQASLLYALRAVMKFMT